MRPAILFACCLLGLALTGCDQGKVGGEPGGPAREGVQELDWDDLIPADWQPETLLDQYNLDELTDEDPRAQELMEKLKALWAEAPVVPELDGKRVRIPGFVVPLDMEASRIGELLLVPYYGACIHVPPPPTNQTIYVKLAPELAFEGETFDTVWVTGTLKVTPTSSELAEAGYRIDGTAIDPYEADVGPQ
jgi:uncharacterized protein